MTPVELAAVLMPAIARAIDIYTDRLESAGHVDRARRNADLAAAKAAAVREVAEKIAKGEPL